MEAKCGVAWCPPSKPFDFGVVCVSGRNTFAHGRDIHRNHGLEKAGMGKGRQHRVKACGHLEAICYGRISR